MRSLHDQDRIAIAARTPLLIALCICVLVCNAKQREKGEIYAAIDTPPMHQYHPIDDTPPDLITEDHNQCLTGMPNLCFETSR